MAFASYEYFIIGNLDSLLNAIISLSIVENAAINIVNLENQLNEQISAQEGMNRRNIEKTIEQSTLSFQKSIHLKGLVYKYDHGFSSKAFSIGPINLNIQKEDLRYKTINGKTCATFLHNSLNCPQILIPSEMLPVLHHLLPILHYTLR